MPTRQSIRNQIFRDKTKKWLIEYRKTLSCARCKEDHPACLSFHHTDPKTKKYTVADMPNRGCSVALIKKEIEKCLVLCHNCHAKLHYEQEERPWTQRENVGLI